MAAKNKFAMILNEIWEENVKKDYENEWFSYESDLQASIYMHLREKLDENYRIYLEQKYVAKSVRPDIIVCNYKDKQQKINCILELKYLPHPGYQKNLSDMEKIERIQNYYKDEGGKFEIWIDGPSKTSTTDTPEWNDEHWIGHLINEDTIFGFILIAPEKTFNDNKDCINEFLKKDKNHRVLAGKTYTKTGKPIFEVLLEKK